MRIPSTIEERQRAIVLLGNRSKGIRLRANVKQELIALVGTYPSPKEAGAFKSALKSLMAGD